MRVHTVHACSDESRLIARQRSNSNVNVHVCVCVCKNEYVCVGTRGVILETFPIWKHASKSSVQRVTLCFLAFHNCCSCVNFDE